LIEQKHASQKVEERQSYGWYEIRTERIYRSPKLAKRKSLLMSVNVLRCLRMMKREEVC